MFCSSGLITFVTDETRRVRLISRGSSRVLQSYLLSFFHVNFHQSLDLLLALGLIVSYESILEIETEDAAADGSRNKHYHLPIQSRPRHSRRRAWLRSVSQLYTESFNSALHVLANLKIGLRMPWHSAIVDVFESDNHLAPEFQRQKSELPSEVFKRDQKPGDDSDEEFEALLRPARISKEQEMEIRLEKQIELLYQRERNASIQEAGSSIKHRAIAQRLSEKVERRGEKPKTGEIVVLQDTRDEPPR